MIILYYRSLWKLLKWYIHTCRIIFRISLYENDCLKKIACSDKTTYCKNYTCLWTDFQCFSLSLFVDKITYTYTSYCWFGLEKRKLINLEWIRIYILWYGMYIIVWYGVLRNLAWVGTGRFRCSRWFSLSRYTYNRCHSAICRPHISSKDT